MLMFISVIFNPLDKAAVISKYPFALSLSKGPFAHCLWFDRLSTNGLVDYLNLIPQQPN